MARAGGGAEMDETECLFHGVYVYYDDRDVRRCAACGKPCPFDDEPAAATEEEA
jgi:hypothetical protein